MKAYRVRPKAAFVLPFGIRLVFGALAGLVFALGLAPFGYWWVSLVSVGVFYALLKPLNPACAFGLGWVYGAGTWAFGVSWLFESIHTHGQVNAVFAWSLIGLLACIMGLFHAVLALAFSKMGRQPLAFSALWVLQEWLKTWLFTGFPWLFLGYAGIGGVLNGLYPVLGIFGVSFVLAFFASSLFEVCQSRAQYLVLSGACVLACTLLTVADVSWTHPQGVLDVSLVQGNIDQSIKWDDAYVYEILHIYERLAQNEWGRDLVLFPEGAITLFQNDPVAQDYITRLSARASAAQSAWVFGVPYVDGSSNTLKTPDFYNAAMAQGTSSGVYKKQRLVPFGEYIPLRGLFDILPNLANNHNVLSHSQGSAGQAPLKMQGINAGMAICYEVAYPQIVRANAQDAAFLMTISNDAWFGASHGPHQHLQMVQARSLETGRYFARATNTGITAVIDHKGRIIARARQFERTVLRATVELRGGNTPFVRLGQAPILGICVLLVVLSIVFGRPKIRH